MLARFCLQSTVGGQEGDDNKQPENCNDNKTSNNTNANNACSPLSTVRKGTIFFCSHTNLATGLGDATTCVCVCTKRHANFLHHVRGCWVDTFCSSCLRMRVHKLIITYNEGAQIWAPQKSLWIYNVSCLMSDLMTLCKTTYI